MKQTESEIIIQQLNQPLLDKGFTFSYTYQKGGDSSCVYIYRFQKGADYFDWRETSGAFEIHFVAFVKGEYRFPNPRKIWKKDWWLFRLKHLFSPASVDEQRKLFASFIQKELDKNNGEFFGILL